MTKRDLLTIRPAVPIQWLTLMELIKSCLAQFNPRTCVVDSPEWYRCAKHPATVVGGAMLHSGPVTPAAGDYPVVTHLCWWWWSWWPLLGWSLHFHPNWFTVYTLGWTADATRAAHTLSVTDTAHIHGSCSQLLLKVLPARILMKWLLVLDGT